MSIDRKWIKKMRYNGAKLTHKATLRIQSRGLWGREGEAKEDPCPREKRGNWEQWAGVGEILALKLWRNPLSSLECLSPQEALSNGKGPCVAMWPYFRGAWIIYFIVIYNLTFFYRISPPNSYIELVGAQYEQWTEAETWVPVLSGCWSDYMWLDPVCDQSTTQPVNPERSLSAEQGSGKPSLPSEGMSKWGWDST